MNPSNQGTAISRRKCLLKLVGLGGAAMASISGCLPQRHEKTNISFLERELVSVEGIDAKEVQDKWCPYMPRVNFRKDDPELNKLLQWVQPSLKPLLQRLPKGNYEFSLAQQEFGLPETEPFSRDAQTYCRSAEQFLHEHIQGLNVPQLQWTILKPGDIYEKNYDGRGFIGRALCSMHTIEVSDKNQKRIVDISNIGWFNQGGRSHPCTPGFAKTGFVFISSNYSIISSPFSELIPLAMKDRSESYTHTMGNEQVEKAVEAFSEAISYLLSAEFVQTHYMRPDAGKRVVKLYKQNFENSKYSDVRAAIAWARTYGIQKTHDLAMENLQKYYSTIQEYGKKRGL